MLNTKPLRHRRLAFCPYVLQDHISGYKYRTLRYPGHLAKLLGLRDIGLFEDGALDNISIRKFFELLAQKIRTEWPADDKIVLRIVGFSKNNNSFVQDMAYCLDIEDRTDELGFSAMERTTGFSVAIVMAMIARVKINPGICLPHQVPSEEFSKEYFSRVFYMSLQPHLTANKPFVAYAHCVVTYDGRAKSVSDPGTRLIIYKSDGSFLIHRGLKILPMNYNGPKSDLVISGNKLTSTSKSGEVIVVDVQDLIWYHTISDWSHTGISLVGTENDMRNYLIDNLYDLLEIEAKRVIKELPTKAGMVDLFVEDVYGKQHCIELKRKRASISAIRQLETYMNYLDEPKGYIVAPGLSAKAIERISFTNEDIRFVPLRPEVIY